MAYTKRDQLTPPTGNLINGRGFLVPGHSFIYVEDLLKVIRQAPDAKLSQLQVVPIVFERLDGKSNHNITQVSGLAITTGDLKTDAQGNITNEDWHDIIGLFWPSFYSPGTVDGIANERTGKEEGAEFNGEPFGGDPSYAAGLELHKSE